MLKSLSSVLVAVTVLVSWTNVAARDAPPVQGSSRADASEAKKAVDKLSDAAARLKAEAAAAGKPQGRQALQSLMSAIVSVEQGLTSFISTSGRLAKGDTKKDVDAMGKQLAALKKEKENLSNLIRQKADDSGARGSLAQRVGTIANDTEGLAQRVRSR